MTDDELHCYNFFYGWIGRWDWNMERCQSLKLKQKQQQLLSDHHDTDTDTDTDDVDYYSSSSLLLSLSSILIMEQKQMYNSILTRIAFLHTMMREYDQALDVYEQELIPRLQKQIDDDNDDSSASSSTSLDIMGLVLEQVSDIYRIKAEYKKGLETVTEARTKLLSSQNRHGSTSVTKTLLLADNSHRFKDMQYLLDAVKEQEGYTAALVKAAKRYHFYDRSHNGGGGIGIGGIGISAASACPQKATKRLYIPPDIVFCVSIGLFVYGTFVFIKRQAPEKRIRRGIMAGAVVLPLLYAITLVWGMTHRSSVEQLNAMASLCAIVGKHDTALELYDEARCHILANPLEESILIGDAGIETFTGPSFIYIKLQLDDMVDALAETIHELVQLNTVLGANILVASHYLSLSITYANRGAEELANTYAELAQREMDQLVQRTEEEINSLLLAQQQPPLVGPSKGNESSKSPDQLLRDKTYYEL
jgi:hypothetical protein